jgi:hypothetical protein
MKVDVGFSNFNSLLQDFANNSQERMKHQMKLAFKCYIFLHRAMQRYQEKTYGQ